MQASKVISVGLVLSMMAMAAPSANSAQVTNNMSMKPMNSAIALGCSAGHGDVSQTITITNTTKSTLAKGTKIAWTLNKAKGVQVLDAALAPGKTIDVLGPPGNGGTCKATITK